MTKNPLWLDKAAITLSVLCGLHCLALPLLIIALPYMASWPLNNEAFHFWMVIAVIPISLNALTLGCRQHNVKRLWVMGAMGLSFLLSALFLGHNLIGESGEKILTLIGASIIATGHVMNYKLCRKKSPCECQPNHISVA